MADEQNTNENNPEEDSPKKTLPHFHDTLSKYIRRIELAEENADLSASIITSDDLYIPALTDGPIKRHQIAWRLYELSMFYIVKADPGTTVEEHFHDEDVFRLLIHGSLKVTAGVEKGRMQKQMTEWQWFVVRAGTPYEIEADCQHGYVALGGYRMRCRPEQIT